VHLNGGDSGGTMGEADGHGRGDVGGRRGVGVLGFTARLLINLKNT